jgi:hypothetical protein
MHDHVLFADRGPLPVDATLVGTNGSHKSKKIHRMHSSYDASFGQFIDTTRTIMRGIFRNMIMLMGTCLRAICSELYGPFQCALYGGADECIDSATLKTTWYHVQVPVAGGGKQILIQRSTRALLETRYLSSYPHNWQWQILFCREANFDVPLVFTYFCPNLHERKRFFF